MNTNDIFLSGMSSYAPYISVAHAMSFLNDQGLTLLINNLQIFLYSRLFL